MTSRADEEQLESLGISWATYQQQIENFNSGFPWSKLDRAANCGDGIQEISEIKANDLIERYDHFRNSLDIVKFVPASGAATRMFKSLFQGLEECLEGKEVNDEVKNFVEHLSAFAFYERLKLSFAEKGKSLEELMMGKNYQLILEEVLLESGLNYGQLPKALIPFHGKKNGQEILPLEEHIKEAVAYANTNNTARIHLTVSADHLEKLKETVGPLREKYATRSDLKITYSTQSESTNTVAVYNNCEPVRMADNSLMFRPGGHGALLNNLNALEAQLIFIKNIDNVSVDTYQEVNIRYKKILAGRLLELREEVHSLLNGLVHESGRKRAMRYIKFRWGKDVQSEDEIKSYLDRPIRVCGMVKNTGAPGGGPFWVNMEDGSTSLQIVESSQIDMTDDSQKAIVESASHFNPVDLVCWVEDHNGAKFDLMKYRDDKTGFISSKSYEGKEIQAQELPGLWNGAMAYWITEFVEVPIETFNPVKTVLDLLKPEHRAN